MTVSDVSQSGLVLFPVSGWRSFQIEPILLQRLFKDWQNKPRWREKKTSSHRAHETEWKHKCPTLKIPAVTPLILIFTLGRGDMRDERASVERMRDSERPGLWRLSADGPRGGGAEGWGWTAQASRKLERAWQAASETLTHLWVRALKEVDATARISSKVTEAGSWTWHLSFLCESWREDASKQAMVSTLTLTHREIQFFYSLQVKRRNYNWLIEFSSRRFGLSSHTHTNTCQITCQLLSLNYKMF